MQVKFEVNKWRRSVTLMWMSKDQTMHSVEREKLDWAVPVSSSQFSVSLALPQIASSSTQQSNNTSKLFLVAQIESAESVWLTITWFKVLSKQDCLISVAYITLVWAELATLLKSASSRGCPPPPQSWAKNYSPPTICRVQVSSQGKF